MEYQEVKKLVLSRYGTDSYYKGINYDADYIEYLGERKIADYTEINFEVESEHYDTFYNVNIYVRDNELLKSICSCPQYARAGRCKHIAACLLNEYDSIFKIGKTIYDVSNDILDEFYIEKDNTIKERLNFEIELDFDRTNIIFKPSIGLSRTYVINTESKFQDFMDAYFNSGKYRFGAKFEFDSTKHYLSEDDEWFLKFLSGYNKTNSYYYSYYYEKPKIFELNEREASIILDKLKDRKFHIKNHGIVMGIINGFPTNINLTLENDDYNLYIEDLVNYKFLGDEYKYILYNRYLYIIPDNYIKLLKMLSNYEVNNIVFKKDKIELFKNGLLKEIKDNINISEDITDIVIAGKPDISLYFDLQRDKIKCDIKLDYNNNIIDYFETNTNIIRDDETEKNIIQDLMNNNFEYDDNKIILSSIDNIGDFLSNGIIELKDKYNIFTSKKIDNMNIINKSTVKSNFSIGQDGIMSYDFNIDNIELSELDSVLSSLKANKKYYKLKSGDIINLDENENIKELGNIISDLEINTKLLEDGSVEVPKYRAFYIDSLRKNKYKSINTSSSFNNFIDNFNKYNNIEIKLDKNDDKILRNYQKDGVKWLYTLYKCDLGGILADEMGLGKSIQTICFIKQIIKEKKNAKIIIVCPTSLVYNWVNEFKKFGKNLKYVAVADNKIRRKEVISKFDKYNIFITSYGLIRNDNDEYEDKQFDLCIIDEAQAIKNYQAGMTKEVKKIKSKTKIALTGTPLENSILELWSIFDFVLPGYLNNIKKFKEKYGISDIDKESLSKLELLNYQIKPFILRRKKNEVYKDLPEKIENTIYLELPKMQKALYIKELNSTKKEMDELINNEGFKKARFKILQLLMKLRQICIDPQILYSDYKYDSIKLEKLVEVVKNYILDGHKILIFSSFKKVIDKVELIFNKEKISSYVISGEVKGKTRTELVDKFNNDNTNCFLITLKSGGTGLNLTSADIVIHLDIWWNPQVENQAADRAHRIGQTRNVSVIKFITKGTIEERILKLQKKKKVLSDNIIEGKDDSTLINYITEKEMKNLLALGDDEL